LIFTSFPLSSVLDQHAVGEEEHRAPALVPRGAAGRRDQRAGVRHQQHAGRHHQAAGQPE